MGRARQALLVLCVCLFSTIWAVRVSDDEAETRAAELVSRMTYDEKFRLIHGVILMFTVFGPTGSTLPIVRLGIPGNTHLLFGDFLCFMRH